MEGSHIQQQTYHMVICYLLLFDQSLGVLHVLLQLHIVALEGIVLLKKSKTNGKFRQ